MENQAGKQAEKSGQFNLEPNRRQLLRQASALGLCLPFLSSLTKAVHGQEGQGAMIAQKGDKRLHVLSDGHLVQPLSFMYPQDGDAVRVKKLLRQNGLGVEAFEPGCNVTLYEDGTRKILFDAGSGSNFVPTAGRLVEVLAANGIEAGAITDVVFTHGHPDHLWGIVDDFDEISFAEARLHFPRAEWDFWRADDVLSRVSENRQAFAVGAQNRLKAMEERIELFDPGAEILSGVEAVDSSGHTPGHTSFVLHGFDVPLMVLGDALTHALISFEHPDWHTAADHDGEAGAKTRKTLLDRLSGDKMAMIGFHLPGSGYGYAEKKGNAYRFVPA